MAKGSTQKRIDSKKRELLRYITYERVYWSEYDYSILKNIVIYGKHRKLKDFCSYADLIIMIDTETSKREKMKMVGKEYEVQENHIVCWAMSLGTMEKNIVTLIGRKPSELITCISKIREYIRCDELYFYIHNLGYDWSFLRQFFIKDFGAPIFQLNTKPRYPINIQFENGIILKDSLILAQRGLEKWSNDLEVEHRKAVGLWDYDKIRHQNTPISEDEWTYQEYDTLSGIECLRATMLNLNCNLSTIPLTATGIPRKEIKRLGGRKAHTELLERDNGFMVYQYKEEIYHGGYVHANRYLVGQIVYGDICCYDFSSSYPYQLFKKYPISKWDKIECSYDEILKFKDRFAYIFTLRLVNVDIKEDVVMPALQISKCYRAYNAIVDNGRIIKADYVEIALCDIDLDYIIPQLKDTVIKDVVNVYRAIKGYLPKWYTDYVYKCFVDKTKLKGGDPVLYSIAKSKLNALYGLACQKVIKPDIVEEYATGKYITNKEVINEDKYNNQIEKSSAILPYDIGIFCTAHATQSLHRLGSMCGTWIYSDTDSVYGSDWDIDKVNAYNKECIDFIKERGYGTVVYNGKEYNLGTAVSEGLKDQYSEFKVMGAKRYAGRCKADNEVHITVSGVPKVAGAKCLNNDLKNFKAGFIFKGEKTGKKTHHFNSSPIHIDEYGNEVADSIDLTPCDYLLDETVLGKSEKVVRKSIFEAHDILGYEVI